MKKFEGIDPQTASSHGAVTPYNVASFVQIRVTEAWQKYDSVRTWGENQCLAILDDGCDLNDPAWQVAGKVIYKTILIEKTWPLFLATAAKEPRQDQYFGQ